MPERVIENPIIDSPYRSPHRHFAFYLDGITDRIIDGRRPSSSSYRCRAPASVASRAELPTFTQDDITLKSYARTPVCGGSP